METIQGEIAYSNRLEDFWVMEPAEQLGVSRQAVSRWELGVSHT
ncbi:MAG: helix-turn-helix transcriptional regulator [Lachnospiraceae bacterium]|nr:helix-turn-helix transcriptional regulator [Lachnospiraceae bacterium]